MQTENKRKKPTADTSVNRYWLPIKEQANAAATVIRKLNMVTTIALTGRTGQKEDVPSVYCDTSTICLASGTVISLNLLFVPDPLMWANLVVRFLPFHCGWFPGDQMKFHTFHCSVSFFNINILVPPNIPECWHYVWFFCIPRWQVWLWSSPDVPQAQGSTGEWKHQN